MSHHQHHQQQHQQQHHPSYHHYNSSHLSLEESGGSVHGENSAHLLQSVLDEAVAGAAEDPDDQCLSMATMKQSKDHGSKCPKAAVVSVSERSVIVASTGPDMDTAVAAAAVVFAECMNITTTSNETVETGTASTTSLASPMRAAQSTSALPSRFPVSAPSNTQRRGSTPGNALWNRLMGARSVSQSAMSKSNANDPSDASDSQSNNAPVNPLEQREARARAFSRRLKDLLHRSSRTGSTTSSTRAASPETESRQQPTQQQQQQKERDSSSSGAGSGNESPSPRPMFSFLKALKSSKEKEVKQNTETDSNGSLPNCATPCHQNTNCRLGQHHLLSDFVLSRKKLGKGAEGSVCLARESQPSVPGQQCRTFAIKKFRRPKSGHLSEREYVKRITAEYCIGSLLHHPNIVETYDVIQDDASGEWYSLLEFCPGGDLFSHILHNDIDSDCDVDCLFKQIMRGVAYMHTMGISHRDLKPENILIGRDLHVRIADFGRSEVIKTNFERQCRPVRGLVGSLPYLAPESFGSEAYDGRASDIWSTGVIFYVMRFHAFPWERADPRLPYYAHYVSTGEDAAGHMRRMVPAAQQLLRRMLEPDPKRRVSAADILCDPYFIAIKVCGEGTLAPEEEHHHERLAHAVRV